MRKRKARTTERKTIQRNRYELRRLQTRVEKAVSKVPGVTSCSVSLLTNSMGVEGTASPAEIIAAVEKAGYGASKEGRNSTTLPSRIRRSAERQGNTGLKTPSDRVPFVFLLAHVFFHGTYDVGLAAAEFFKETTSPWDWYSCCLP